MRCHCSTLLSAWAPLAFSRWHWKHRPWGTPTTGLGASRGSATSSVQGTEPGQAARFQAYHWLLTALHP